MDLITTPEQDLRIAHLTFSYFLQLSRLSSHGLIYSSVITSKITLTLVIVVSTVTWFALTRINSFVNEMRKLI